MKMISGMKINWVMGINVGHEERKWIQYWWKWRRGSKCITECIKQNVWKKNTCTNTCISELPNKVTDKYLESSDIQHTGLLVW